jgi:ankyrin repeat protein
MDLQPENKGTKEDDLLGPLNRAVKRQDVFEVRRLIAAGDDVRACDGRGVAPVLLAADRGNTVILRLLLDAGADPNTSWSGGWTPLVRAAAAGSGGAVALLLERGAALNVEMAAGRWLPVAALVRQFWPERTSIIELLERAEHTSRDQPPRGD